MNYNNHDNIVATQFSTPNKKTELTMENAMQSTLLDYIDEQVDTVVNLTYSLNAHNKKIQIDHLEKELDYQQNSIVMSIGLIFISLFMFISLRSDINYASGFLIVITVLAYSVWSITRSMTYIKACKKVKKELESNYYIYEEHIKEYIKNEKTKRY